MKYPVLLLVAAFIIGCCLPAFAGDTPAAPSVQKSVQKSPVQNVPVLKVEVPVQKQIQKSPVQRGVIQKTREPRVRFRSRLVIRERGRLFSRAGSRVDDD